MYVTGSVLLPFFSLATMLIAVPTGGVKILLGRHAMAGAPSLSKHRCCGRSDSSPSFSAVSPA
jgi:hypothetical protein